MLVDHLYRQSIRFKNFQASPTCAPSRSAIMTGIEPFKNGVTHTIYERERLSLANSTIAQNLKSLGYTTGIFGKWHLGDEEAYQPDHRGFDEVFIHGAGGIGQHYQGSCSDVSENTYMNPIIKHNGTFEQTNGFCTDVFFQQALGWIKQMHHERKPFFAYIATNAPHAPYIAPEKYTRKFKEEGYGKDAQGFYGMIENIDDNIGLLMKKLDEWGMAENTILVFMSDNGKAWFRNKEPLGRSGVPDTYNAGMKGYKGSVYEGGTRVPFFIRWQGTLQTGKDIPFLASHYDIFPTFIEIAGGKIPEGIDGRSLMPLLKNTSADWQDRYLFIHKGRWELGENPDQYKYQTFAIRNQRFRLVNNKELFDLQADPGEENNVIKDYSEVAEQMMEAYEKWWGNVRPLMINEGYKYEGNEPPFVLEFNRQKTEKGIPDWITPKL
ncbi:MAG: arylsulfatase [Ignavibacteria bacterium]|nr:arylsulfatase [Ignavibacteria bacterium]